jgi:hypothetical protein
MVGNNNTLTAMGFKRKRGGEQHNEQVETHERREVTMETEKEEERAGSVALAQAVCYSSEESEVGSERAAHRGAMGWRQQHMTSQR